MNLPDAHTHSSTAASGTAPRFICGTSPADWKQVALLAERDEHVTPFFGIHPWFLNPAEWKEEMPRLESLLQKIPHAGVGETGLDKCRRGIPGLPLQKEALERHLELAVRLDRPASLHCCRAWGTLADIASRHGISFGKLASFRRAAGNGTSGTPCLHTAPSAGAGIGRASGNPSGTLPTRGAGTGHDRQQPG